MGVPLFWETSTSVNQQKLGSDQEIGEHDLTTMGLDQTEGEPSNVVKDYDLCFKPCDLSDKGIETSWEYQPSDKLY